MLKKIAFALLLASFVVSQMAFFTARQNAATTENAEMLELATALPESDVVMAMDFDRTLNVAAANILGNDAQKIENLKGLMKTIENHTGFNPYEIKQVALGVKLPQGDFDKSFDEFEFAAIVRTSIPNGNMLDVWSKRMSDILAFEEEKAPTRGLIEDFRRFRDAKFSKATPERIAESVKNLEDALKKTRELNTQIDALPKTTVTPASVNSFKKQNQALTATINKYLLMLKADTETKNLRSQTIKLLNRWNALAVDDPQKSAKLAAIKKEAEAIHPVYKKKFEARQELEELFEKFDAEAEFSDTGTRVDWTTSVNNELDKTGESLKNLSPAKLKRSAELNDAAESLSFLNSNLEDKLGTEETMVDPSLVVEGTKDENVSTASKASKDFYETMKQARREQIVNGKRMVVIDMSKFNPPPVPMDNGEAKETTEKTIQKKNEPNMAVGFLDENRMVIGFEKTVAEILNHDANYKNQKAAEMLNNSKNPLFSFAINSTLVKNLSEEISKIGAKPAPSMMDNFLKDINIYGSINYDGDSSVTNDITMSLGFFRQNVENIFPPPTNSNDPNEDNTFEIGGLQFGKSLFYDLLNSFKAIQASVTVKFEKKKIASLVKSAPRILDNITANKNDNAKTKSAKPENKTLRRADSVQDLITTPQVYVDLFKLLTEKAG